MSYKKPNIIPSQTNNKNMERYLHRKLSEAGEGGGDGSGGKSPYIGENGHWFEWNADQKEFVDTGVTAQGKEGKQGVPGVANAKYKQVETLPTAGADTMDFIYLTPSQTAGVYDMSYTEQDGDTYTWKALGTTAIQLSDYATEAEVTQLQEKVNDIDWNTSDADVHQVNAGSTAETASGNRLRLVFPAITGSIVSASCSLGKGVAANVYDTVNNALLASTNQIQTISAAYKSLITAEIVVDGYLVISLCKSDSSSFTAEEKAAYLAATTISVVKGSVGKMQVDLRKKVTNLSFLSIQTAGVLNANNTTKKFEIPEIYIFDENGSHQLSAREVSYTWGSASRIAFALVVSDDYSTISMIEWTGITNHTKILALIRRETSGKTTVSRFYGGSSSLFSVDGENCDSRINDIKNSLNELETRVDSLDSPEIVELFLGRLVQKGLAANNLTTSTQRVSTESKMVVPYVGCKLTFKIPSPYAIGIRSGNKAENLSNNDYWFEDGDTFTFQDDVRYFRLCFAGKAGEPFPTITVEEVKALIDSGAIRITYEDGDKSIIERNFETEKYVKGAMRNFVSGATNNGSLTKLPIFAHTSDVHGDAKRFNQFVEYCDFLGVDAALVSGDTTPMAAVNDAMQYINDIADERKTPVYICMGNHDARSLNTAQLQNETVMGYLITKNAAVTNSQETYPTYYYKDFADKKIRLIALNIYEVGSASDTCAFSQAQCDWFISSLASTPEDYGVLVMFHSPESLPSAPSGKEAFRQSLLNYTGLQSGLSGTPFAKIIDAFIGKTTLSLTYTSNGTEISTTADFTGVASGVEFIAFVNGHLHTDTVGYSQNTTYKQLNLNVCCGVSVYGTAYPYLANNSDLPRDAQGATQDCFNIYAIDRAAKIVRIAKVGSNITAGLTERKYMSISYAD